jgi:hypothetical protein
MLAPWSVFRRRILRELQAGGPHMQDVPGIGPCAPVIREGWAEHQGVTIDD